MANGSVDSGFQYFKYSPSKAAAILFAILFLFTTVLHSYQLIRLRTRIMIPLAIGGIFEVIGYIGRVVASNQTPNWTLGPYIVQELLILVAPALFAATVYMQLSRIILLANGEKYALIKKRWLTPIFVTGDVLSFLTQGGGGGLSASASTQSTGKLLIIAGLGIQVVFFGFFVFVAFLFHLRMRTAPKIASQQSLPWKRHLYVLYFTSICIFVRSIMRVTEYVQGFNGYILTHEYFLYVFDAVLMWAVMVIFNIEHPSEVTALMNGGRIMRGLKVGFMVNITEIKA